MSRARDPILIGAPQSFTTVSGSYIVFRVHSRHNYDAVLIQIDIGFAFYTPSPLGSLRRISFLINTFLLLFVMDFVTRPTRYPARDVDFFRVGAIEHNSAKVSIRFPGRHADGRLAVKAVFWALWNAKVFPGSDRPSSDEFGRKQTRQ